MPRYPLDVLLAFILKTDACVIGLCNGQPKTRDGKLSALYAESTLHTSLGLLAEQPVPYPTFRNPWCGYTAPVVDIVHLRGLFLPSIAFYGTHFFL